MKRDLRDVVYANDHLADLDAGERRLALRALLAESLDEAVVGSALKEVTDEIEGYGPLSDLMTEPGLTDIFVNGHEEIWVDGPSGLCAVDTGFASEAELRNTIDRLLGRAGSRADVSHPVADALLPDGSRINVVLPPISSRGPLVSIRCFPQEPLSFSELSRIGMFTEAETDRLASAVLRKETIVISGGTGCGKTTLLNALLGLIPQDERVLTIEETPELRPSCRHRISLLAREPNAEGRGLVTQERLVRCALRMRPDRIVVGEVRGPEALAALSAMSVGHEGSMVTIHSRSSRDVIPRFVSLALQAGSGASETALERRVRDCFDLYVHLARSGTQRKVVEMVEQTTFSRSTP